MSNNNSSAREEVNLSDLESIYSLDHKPNEFSLCKIAYTDALNDDSDSDSTSEHSNLEVFEASPFSHIQSQIPRILLVQESLPLTKVHLLTSTYAKPIHVTRCFDIGLTISIINSKIPRQLLETHYQQF